MRRRREVKDGSRETQRSRGEEDERGNQQMQCGKDRRRMVDENEASFSTESSAA